MFFNFLRILRVNSFASIEIIKRTAIQVLIHSVDFGVLIYDTKHSQRLPKDLSELKTPLTAYGTSDIP